MDITSLYSVSSPDVIEAAKNTVFGQIQTEKDTKLGFNSFLTSALDNVNTANSYISDAEDEKVRWAMGETDNTHDLTISLWKASTSFQYTVALRDKLMEAYKELMQMSV